MDAEGLYRAFGCGHSFWMGKQRSGTTGGSLRAAHAVLLLPHAGVFLPWPGIPRQPASLGEKLSKAEPKFSWSSSCCCLDKFK